MLKNIKFVLEYDGWAYHGWQKQSGLSTVQGQIEETLSAFFCTRVQVMGAGRTDAGVHAKGQVANCLVDTSLSALTIMSAINHYLPINIRIKKAENVPLNFHSQKDACYRLYSYFIYNYPINSPFYHNYTWWVIHSLDTELMKEAMRFLVGKHDFASFQNQGSPSSSTWREIKKIYLRKGSLISIFIQGDSFLYKMVRNIVGTLVEVGRRKISPARVKRILELSDRKKAGPTAPAQGLYLMRVGYSRSPQK